mmetsp:Transcript_11440/g.15753  ORF Transcript_11440/g.15753 Transcript_11440/m.15753 type:complete len:91 (-) Transcript_11440:1355-1627(-)
MQALVIMQTCKHYPNLLKLRKSYQQIVFFSYTCDEGSCLSGCRLTTNPAATRDNAANTLKMPSHPRLAVKVLDNNNPPIEAAAKAEYNNP